MGKIKMTIEADYQRLLAMRKEIESLETYLKTLDLRITPTVEVDKVEKDLKRVKDAYTNLHKELSKTMAQTRGLLGSNPLSNLTGGAKDATTNVGKLNNALDEADKSTRSMTDNIKHYFEKFSGALLAYKAIGKLSDMIKGSVGRIMSFESANSSLAAIAGMTNDELEDMKFQAEELGRKTVFTASQVTQLQIELAKLGFVKPQIEGMQRAVLDFAQATGADLANASATAGAALRMFGLESQNVEENQINAARVVNAMSAATRSSALNFQAISDNLAQFGPVAKQLGFTIEDSLALFGAIKNAGVDGSVAATSLRNIFNEMAGGKLTDKIGFQVHDIETFTEALRKLGKTGFEGAEGVKNAMKDIGKRGGAQFLTLIQAEKNGDIERIRREIYKGVAQGSVDTMGKTMTNNLMGQLKMLDSAWEGFMLSFRESDGVAKEVVAMMTDSLNKLRDIIASSGDLDLSGMRDSVKDVVDAMLALISVFGVYKGYQKAVTELEAIQISLRKAGTTELLTTQEVEMRKRRESMATEEQGVKVKHSANLARATEVEAIKATIMALREEQIQEMLTNRATTDVEMQELAIKEKALVDARAEVQSKRELLALRIEELEALTLSTDVQAREMALKEKEVAQQELQNAVEEERIALLERERQADQALRNQGHAQLTTDNIGNTANKFSWKSLGSAMGINPVTIALVALSAAIYGAYKAWEKYTESSRRVNEMHEEIAKVTKEMEKTTKSQVNEINLQIGNMRALEKTSDEYGDAVRNLSKEYEKYKIKIEETKDADGKLITVEEQMIAKKDLLIGKIKEEATERAHLDAIKAAETKEGENIEEDNDEYIKKFKDNLGEIGGKGIAESLLANVFTEETMREIAQRQLLISKEYQKGSIDINEVSRRQNDLYDGVLTRQAVILKQMGASTQEIYQAQMWALKLLTTRVGKAKELLGVLEVEEQSYQARLYSELKLQGMTDEAIKKELRRRETMKLSELSAKGLEQALDNVVKKLNKNYSLNIKYNIDDKSVPDWMKKDLGIGSKNGGNLKLAKDRAASYIKAIEEMEKKGKMFAKGTDGQMHTMEYFVKMASQYESAVFMIERAQTSMEEKKKDTDTPQANSDASAKNEAMQLKEKQEKFNELKKKYADESKEIDRKIANDIEQARINALSSGTNKELAQRQLDHKKRIEEINKEAKDELKAEKERVKQIWDADVAHQEQKARNETKNKKGEVKKAGRDAKERKKFEEEDYKNGTGEFAKGGAYYEYAQRRAKMELEVEKRKIAEIKAINQELFDEISKDHETETQKRRRELSEITTSINAMKDLSSRFTYAKMLKGSTNEDEVKTYADILADPEKTEEKLKAIEAQNVDLGKKMRQWVAYGFSSDEIDIYNSLNGDAQNSLNEYIDEINEGIKHANNEVGKLKISWEIEDFKKTPEYVRAFEDLNNESFGSLQGLLSKFTTLRDNIAPTEENMENLREVQGIINNIIKAMVDNKENASLTMMLQQAEASAKSLADADKALALSQEQYNKALREYENNSDDTIAQNNLAVATRALNNAQNERNSAYAKNNKVTKELIAKTGVYCASIEKLGGALSNLGKEIGGVLGESLMLVGDITTFATTSIKSIQEVSAMATGALKTLETASVILTILSTAIQLSKKVSELMGNIFGGYDKAVEKQKKVTDLIDAINDYRMAVIRARNAEKEWFNSSGLEHLRDMGDVGKQAMNGYRDAMNEAQEVYKDSVAPWKKVTAITAMTIGAAAAAFTGGMSLMATAGIAAGTLLGSTALASAGESMAYKSGQTSARNNMRMQTQKKSFFKSEKTENLEEWVKKNMHQDLFGKDGSLNLELAQTLLSDYGDKLVGQTKETLEKLVECQEQYNEFMDSVKEYVSNMFSPLVDNMTDAVWTWLESGQDALYTFKQSASETFKSIAKDMIKNLVSTTIFADYQDQLKELTKEYSLGGMTEENYMSKVLEYTNGVTDRATKFLPQIQDATRVIQEAFDKAGYDIVDSAQSTAKSRGFGQMTQETGDEMNGRLTAIQMAVEQIRGYLANFSLELLQVPLNTLVTYEEKNSLCLTDMRDILAKSLLQLELIESHTNDVVAPIIAMKDDMYKMRVKMDTL